MILDQTAHYFNGVGEEDERDKMILRILYPSDPYGVWPGTMRTIREWKICKKGSGAYLRPTKEEIIELEKELGELNREPFFTNHPTLGLVAY
jgi:hypothetical protein